MAQPVNPSASSSLPSLPSMPALPTLPSIPTREDLTAGVNNTLANVQGSVGDLKNNVNSTLGEFSSANAMNASSEFLNSNSIIAKFGFLLLVLIAFLGLMRVGMLIIAFIFTPAKQPYLVKGLLRGSVPVTIKQDPADTKSPVVYRSNNQSGGVEFTWCVWLLIDSVGSTPYKHSHIFNKGNDIYDSTSNSATYGVATVNNSPGLYLNYDSASPYNPTNALIFYMDTISSAGGNAANRKELVVDNIPMKKWFHVAFRLKDYNLDCYVNGMLSSSVSFGTDVPKQNYDDVHIGKNDGFNGSLSNLRYYDYALSAFDLNALVNYGPNMTPSSLDGKPNGVYDYLGLGWYSAFK
jgi:hypothetical protein